MELRATQHDNFYIFYELEVKVICRKRRQKERLKEVERE